MSLQLWMPYSKRCCKHGTKGPSGPWPRLTRGTAKMLKGTQAHTPDIFLLVLSIESLITVMSAGRWPSQTTPLPFSVFVPLIVFVLFEPWHMTNVPCVSSHVLTKVIHWSRLLKRKARVYQCDAFTSKLTTDAVKTFQMRVKCHNCLLGFIPLCIHNGDLDTLQWFNSI